MPQSRSGQVNNGYYTKKNEEEEARNTSCMDHFRLILQRLDSYNPLTQFSANFGSRSGHAKSSWVKFLVCFLELKWYLSYASCHAESHSGIFMFVSTFQRPNRCISKLCFKVCGFSRFFWIICVSKQAHCLHFCYVYSREQCTQQIVQVFGNEKCRFYTPFSQKKII